MFASIFAFLGIFILTFGSSSVKMSYPNNLSVWRTVIRHGDFAKRMKYVWIYGLIVLLFGVFLWVRSMFDYNTELIEYFLPFIAMIIPIPFGLIFGEKKTVQANSTEKNCLTLGQYEPIQKVDLEMDRIHTIEIFCNGIEMKDATNFTFETVVFSRYSLGNLDKGKQLVAIAYYFMQKYPEQFKLKYNENNSTLVDSGSSAGNIAAAATNITMASQGNNIVSVLLTRR